MLPELERGARLIIIFPPETSALFRIKRKFLSFMPHTHTYKHFLKRNHSIASRLQLRIIYLAGNWLFPSWFRCSRFAFALAALGKRVVAGKGGSIMLCILYWKRARYSLYPSRLLKDDEHLCDVNVPHGFLKLKTILL